MGNPWFKKVHIIADCMYIPFMVSSKLDIKYTILIAKFLLNNYIQLNII